MKKILFSLLALVVLVGCGQVNGTPESRYEDAVKIFKDEKSAMKVSVSSVFDNTQVRIQNDNMGHVLLDDAFVYADVKISLDDGYEDVDIYAENDAYTVVNGDEITVDTQEYVEKVGAALYGQFRDLLDEETPEIEETVSNDVTSLNFDLNNPETVFNIIATNELHELALDSAVGNGTLDFDKSGNLLGGTLFVEFSGLLSGETFTGSTKLEFSMVDVASVEVPESFQ